MAKKEVSSITQEEFKDALDEIFAEFESEIDVRIRVDKALVDEHNGKITRVGNYKSKIVSYESYPGKFRTTSSAMTYAEIGAKNLGDLIENRDRYVRNRVYAYVLSESFPDRAAAIKARLQKGLRGGEWPVYPFVGALVGVFFGWWVAACLGVLGLALGLILRSNRDRQACELCSKRLDHLRKARKYVEAEISLMSEEEKKEINRLKMNFNTKKYTSEFTRREIGVLNAQIDALTKVEISDKTPDSSNTDQVSDADSGRCEIVDEQGRTQGYVEDGRLYDNKNDLVGYVDRESRVYDKSGSRTGEVEGDGRITKYK